MNYLRFLIFTALAATASINSAIADMDNIEQIDPVARVADGALTGESSLLRFTNRVQAVVRTSDLDPGSAVTVWWRIYNRPRHCAMPFACEASDLSNPRVDGSQLHATAFVVGESNGTATVVATLYRNSIKAQGGELIDDSFVEGHLKGRGLRRPLDAEIELLLASHGRVADPVMNGDLAALEQLLTPAGTRLDCADPDAMPAGRTFRCGVIQKVDHRKPR